MAVESATYINQLDATKPSGSDSKAEGDDQIRLVKSTIKSTFPNFTAAPLNATQAQLDKLVTAIVPNTSTPAGAIAIDASGNFGVGGVPDGFGSNYRSLELKGPQINAGGSVIRLGNQNGSFFFDAFIDAGSALSVLRSSGAMALLTAETERLRVDASGNVISSVPASPPGLTANRSMVMNLVSNTTLRISVRGADGVTRTADITLA